MQCPGALTQSDPTHASRFPPLAIISASTGRPIRSSPTLLRHQRAAPSIATRPLPRLLTAARRCRTTRRRRAAWQRRAAPSPAAAPTARGRAWAASGRRRGGSRQSPCHGTPSSSTASAREEPPRPLPRRRVWARRRPASSFAGCLSECRQSRRRRCRQSRGGRGSGSGRRQRRPRCSAARWREHVRREAGLPPAGRTRQLRRVPASWG
mmetsp:Transcript_39530/g.130477  ORF Transcript_39530/g.130477 Transcript_39530/m.130477 type:complete len:209 (-) Transcript_39530:26-652(-)